MKTTKNNVKRFFKNTLFSIFKNKKLVSTF